MAKTQIRGNNQVKDLSITNQQIASDAAIATSKLAEGSELLKRDGSVALTGDMDAASHKVTNVAAPVADTDAARKVDIDTVSSALTSAVAAEEAARIAGDEALQGAIDALDSSSSADLAALAGRVTTAEGDINTLESDLAAEVARATAAEGQLSSAVAAEEAARIAGDAATLSSAQSYADQKISDLVSGAPQVLDTLKELSDALGGDQNFASTLATNLSNLSADISAEEAARIAADAALQSALDQATAGVYVTREVPSGAIDGSNTVFILANPVNAGSEQVFVNGVLMNSGAGNDYTISGATITFASAPNSGDVIVANYISDAIVVATGTGGGGGTSSSMRFVSQEFVHTSSENGTLYAVPHNFGDFPDYINVQVKVGSAWINHCDYCYAGASFGYGIVESSDINTAQVKVYNMRLDFVGPGGTMLGTPTIRIVCGRF